MLALGSYEKCKLYLKFHSPDSEYKKEVFPCITLSRQTGSGSYEVSEKLITIYSLKQKIRKIPGHILIKIYYIK